MTSSLFSMPMCYPRKRQVPPPAESMQRVWDGVFRDVHNKIPINMAKYPEPGSVRLRRSPVLESEHVCEKACKIYRKQCMIYLCTTTIIVTAIIQSGGCRCHF